MDNEINRFVCLRRLCVNLFLGGGHIVLCPTFETTIFAQDNIYVLQMPCLNVMSNAAMQQHDN
jgi:hypothetical protein